MRTRRIENKTKVKSKLDFKGFKIYILSGVCAVMAITSIFMTIESATNGSEFARLQKKEAELLSVQAELQQSLVKTLSVNSLQEQSTDLGFIRVSNLVYVANTETVAAKLP